MNELLGTVRQKARGLLNRLREHFHDGRHPTYSAFPGAPAELSRLVGGGWPRGAECNEADAILRHEFDLLGSGPVNVGYGRECRGFLGHKYQSTELPIQNTAHELVSTVTTPNRAVAQSLRSEISPDYRPIDWSRDFRSGYRWPSGRAPRLYAAAPVPASDIKWPWELGRLQHLPALAWACDGSRSCQRLAAEFRNEVLDFTAANPPRTTVQWSCTMDVAIRATNALVAFDLFRAAGIRFDDRFARAMLDLAWQHFRHIVGYLEWDSARRNNHYFANLVGLLFTLAYLPSFSGRRRWVNFAVSEFEAEILRQFYPDGGNFEGSTAYHSLGLELAAFGIAAASRLRASLSPLVLERTGRAANYASSLQKPSRADVQFGDNDSGRFFVLTGTSIARSHLPNARGALDAYAGIRGESLDTPNGWLAAAIAGESVRVAKIETHTEFPHAGVHILRNQRTYVAIRAARAPAHCVTGHLHADALSIEACIDGTDLVRDPGTFIYSACPAERNSFRSPAAHNFPVPAAADTRWPPPELFVLNGWHNATVHERTSEQIMVENRSGQMGRRRVALQPAGVVIDDSCEGTGPWTLMLTIPGQHHCEISASEAAITAPGGERFILSAGGARLEMRRGDFLSTAYGCREPAWQVTLRFEHPEIRWSLYAA